MVAETSEDTQRFPLFLGAKTALSAYDWSIMSGTAYKRVTCSADETKHLAATLVPYLCADDVMVLKGGLGAGKTQFVAGIAAGIGISTPIVSPTFTILAEYKDARLPLYHFDLYRLESAQELEDIGYFDTLESGGVTCIEWGDKFPEALPENYLCAELTFQRPVEKTDTCDSSISDKNTDYPRMISVCAFGKRAQILLHKWVHNPDAHLTKQC